MWYVDKEKYYLIVHFSLFVNLNVFYVYRLIYIVCNKKEGSKIYCKTNHMFLMCEIWLYEHIKCAFINSMLIIDDSKILKTSFLNNL